uniref:Uncharacterized protein n=1 Tax=Panagrolaimus sp. PS1159 TaxID=55785 RepID=A0AC35G0D3_9BILA
MGNNFSSEPSSNDNSRNGTPNNNSFISNQTLAARLSALSFESGNNSSNNLQEQLFSNSSNQGPPSLAAAAAIAARQRLIEELQYLAQQRYIDEVTINYNLNQNNDNDLLSHIELPQQQHQQQQDNEDIPNLVRSDEEYSTAHQSTPEQQNDNSNQNNDENNSDDDDNEYSGLSLFQRIQISLLSRQLIKYIFFMHTLPC